MMTTERHPKGLYILFLTETWAHFSYFGMQAMLFYYMTKSLDYSQSSASALYGGYVAFAYLTPLFGGMIADRWIGQKRAVIWGGIIMAIGHFALAFDSGFFPGLALVGLGNGLFLPSTTTQVAQLYAPDDPRIDRAYAIYYVGLNLGAFLAPLVCGTLGELYGWHYGFAAAGVGMLIGLATYLAGQRTLAPEPARGHRTGGAPESTIGDTEVVKRLAVVALFVVLFRIAYEQSGITIAIWADNFTDRTISLAGDAYTIPATWFQSINPLFIFLMAPLLARHWARQGRRDREPSTLRKMSIGCLFGAAAFLVMAFAGLRYEAGGLVSWGWLVGFFLLLTWGELYVFPIGLSLFSQRAPVAMASAMIGAWYLAKFAGGLLAGWLGVFWQDMAPATFFLVGMTASLTAALALHLAHKRRLIPTSQGLERSP